MTFSINIWIKWHFPYTFSINIAPTFGKVKDCSFHYFSDACKKEYGQVTYLRAVDESGKVHCSLVMEKAQVAPLKYITIPRMELVAATLSVKTSVMLWKDFNFQLQEKYFGQIVKLFWVTSETNQENSKCLLQIQLKSSKKIPVTPSSFM